MSKIKLAFLGMLFANSALIAALPPLAQSEREIQAILSSKEGYKLLGGADPIEKIIRIPTGYLVITTRKKMKVDVKYTNSDKIGPLDFELKFHHPEDAD